MSSKRQTGRLGPAHGVTGVVPQTGSAQGAYGAPGALKADAPSTLMTADDLAARWQVTPKQVYALAYRGEIPCVRIGRYFRFRLSAIEAWEAEQEQGGQNARLSRSARNHGL